jgi:hypothetical protein
MHLGKVVSGIEADLVLNTGVVPQSKKMLGWK